MTNVYYDEDAGNIKKALEEKIPLQDGVVIDWKYFGEILEQQRTIQIDALIAENDPFIAKLMKDKRIGCRKQRDKNFLFYHKIKDIFDEFPIDIKKRNKSPDKPKDNYFGDFIYQIKAGKTPNHITPLIAWLWRDHEEVARNFYQDIGLEPRPYKHLSNAAAPQNSDDIRSISKERCTPKNTQKTENTRAAISTLAEDD